MIFKKNKKTYIKIHPLFILLGVFSIFIKNFFFFILYTLSVLLHELGHAFVAYKRGYKMNQIILLPYGAVVCGENDEFTPKDEIIIALAGPITNFSLSIFCVALWWMFPASYSYTLDFCMASLVAGIFNLLPLFPLDGGRVFLGYLSTKTTRNIAVKIVKITTTIFSLLLFIIFICSFFFAFNISIGIMAILLFSSVALDSKNIKYERLFYLFNRRKQIVRGIEEKQVIVSSKSQIKNLLSKVERGKLTKFIIVDENFNRCSEIDENKLRQLIEIYPFTTTIKDII